jgi:GrpB-like predicted nucleotidyltransferase (UPF0157 family)
MYPFIEIVPYRSNWPADFQRISAILRALMPEKAVLHHIGSTAVPDLPANDIVDVQMTVDRLEDLNVARLEGAGFKHVPNRTDHSPPGQSLADRELSKLFFKLDNPASHLHVRERGRFNQRYALVCRDYLRINARAAAAYAKVKVELAERFFDDPVSYYAIKDPVFDVIMAGAEEWAASNSWVEPPFD